MCARVCLYTLKHARCRAYETGMRVEERQSENMFIRAGVRGVEMTVLYAWKGVFVIL